MPLFRSRRVVDEAGARIARERLATLRSQRVQNTAPTRRGGWIPQVPAALVVPTEPAFDVSDPRLDAAVERYWNLPDEQARPPRLRPGRHRARGISVRDPAADVAGDHDENGVAPESPIDRDDGVDGDPRAERRRDRIVAVTARFGLGRTHLMAVALALVVGLVVTGVMAWAARPQVHPVDVDVVATGTPLPGSDISDGLEEESEIGGPQSAPGDAGEVVVHVDGKVATPGVVTLPAGSRVVDAIDAAGGVEPDVDLTPLNLARVLTDGEQVLVGVDPPPGADDGSHEGGGTGAPGAGSLLDLNTATAGDLESLPGIGPTLAQRILTWRAEHGTFSTVEELREVTGIGERKFADLEPLVTV